MHVSSSRVQGSWSAHTHTYTTAASSRYLRGCFCSFSSSWCFCCSSCCCMRCCRPRALLMHFCILPWALALLSCKVCLSLATTQTKHNKKRQKKNETDVENKESSHGGHANTHYKELKWKGFWRVLNYEEGVEGRVTQIGEMGNLAKSFTQMLNSLKHKMIKL